MKTATLFFTLYVLSLVFVDRGIFSSTLRREYKYCYRPALLARGVNDSGLESAPEYEFGSFLEILDGDSGSGSFLVWS